MSVLSLTAREEFLASYSSDPVAGEFTNFLFNRDVNYKASSDLSNAHTATIAILFSLQTQNETLFREVYDELSRRKPQVDAPWILNDQLFYGLVLGAMKFDGKFEWIRDTLLHRKGSTQGELGDIAETMLDILSENWGNKENLRPMILMAKYHLGLDYMNSDLPNEIYLFGIEKKFPCYQSSFLNALYLRAFDVAFLAKIPENPVRKKAVTRLIDSLWRKAQIAGWLMWFIALVCCVIIAFKGAIWVKQLTDGSVTKEWLETLSLLQVPVIGVLPVWPLWAKRKNIVASIQRFFLRKLFGLDPDLFPQS